MALDIHHPFLCPYCSQRNTLWIDVTGGDFQELVVDCEVCCAPIIARVSLDDDRIDYVDIHQENE